MSVYVQPTSPDLSSQTPYANNPIGSGTPPASVGSFVISQYGTNTVANGTVDFIDPEAANFSRRFYRALDYP